MSAAYTVADLGNLPGGLVTTPRGINNSGDVVGESAVGNIDYLQPFLYTGGTIQRFGNLPSGTTGSAVAINDTGQVIVNASGPASSNEAGLFTGSSVQDLGAYTPTAIDNQGQVVLNTVNSAYLYTDGAIEQLDTTTTTVVDGFPLVSGPEDCQGYGINDEGVVVGEVGGPGSHADAAVWEPALISRFRGFWRGQCD